MSDSEPNPDRQLTVIASAKAPRISASVTAFIVVPTIIAEAGDAAAKRFLEFFAVTIRNRGHSAGCQIDNAPPERM